MISIRGRVTGETTGGAWVSFESPSRACQHCSCVSMNGIKGCATEREVWLPLARQTGDTIALSLSTIDSLGLITHSLALPLAGFVAGTLGMQALGVGEPMVVLGAVLGLGCGILLCKKQSLNRFQIDRGKNDSS